MVKGFVYVIESPSDYDLLDGRTEGRSLCEALKLASIPNSYNLVTTKKSFEHAITDRLLNDIRNFDKWPIIHMSMHGNNDGVEFTNGEFLCWQDLYTKLAPLTNAMNGGLLICMSSCFGAAGCRMAMHEKDDLPFWALVGNTSEANWGDAAVAYITFYHLFFKGKLVEECVTRMKMASGDDNFMFFLGQHLKQNWASHIANVRRDQLAEAVRTFGERNLAAG